MLVCCCSLAGTPACFNCGHRRSYYGDYGPHHFMPPEWNPPSPSIIPKSTEEEIKKFLTPIESTEDMVRRIVKEEIGK